MARISRLRTESFASAPTCRAIRPARRARPSFDRSLHELGREERERDHHIDLSNAAFVARSNLLDTGDGAATMSPRSFGIEGVTDEDRAYSGSRFSDVCEALFANPYQRTWGRLTSSGRIDQKQP